MTIAANTYLAIRKLFHMKPYLRIPAALTLSMDSLLGLYIA
ncbi:MAG: hypothetical protein WCR56_02450 [Bacilli bacterium]